MIKNKPSSWHINSRSTGTDKGDITSFYAFFLSSAEKVLLTQLLSIIDNAGVGSTTKFNS